MYFRLQLSGTIAGVEEFTLNPVYDAEGEGPDGWSQAGANSMIEAAAAVSVPPDLRLLCSGQTKFTQLRLEGRSSVDDSLLGVAVASYTGEQPESSHTAVLPPQSAVVISLRTDTPTASGRGRLYFPAMGGQIGQNLRLATPTTEHVATAAATYLKSVQDAMEGVNSGMPPWATLRLAVRSKTTKTTPHVRRLMVGDVIDTQRRRRDALPENYVTSPFPMA